MALAEYPSEWIAQAVAGDAEALGTLLVAHYDELRSRLASRVPASLGQLISVDDLVQQTYAAALAGIGGMNTRTCEGFAAWLYAIAENQLKNTMDALAAQKRGGGWKRVRMSSNVRASSLLSLARLHPDGSDTPRRKLARREAINALKGGLEGLPNSQRLAVRLHHFDGKTLEQTAAAMDRSPGAVRGLLQRARSALREAMGRSSRWFSRR